MSATLHGLKGSATGMYGRGQEEQGGTWSRQPDLSRTPSPCPVHSAEQGEGTEGAYDAVPSASATLSHVCVCGHGDDMGGLGLPSCHPVVSCVLQRDSPSTVLHIIRRVNSPSIHSVAHYTMQLTHRLKQPLAPLILAVSLRRSRSWVARVRTLCVRTTWPRPRPPGCLPSEHCLAVPSSQHRQRRRRAFDGELEVGSARSVRAQARSTRLTLTHRRHPPFSGHFGARSLPVPVPCASQDNLGCDDMRARRVHGREAVRRSDAMRRVDVPVHVRRCQARRPPRALRAATPAAFRDLIAHGLCLDPARRRLPRLAMYTSRVGWSSELHLNPP